ncbi:MAG: serine/threonine-protein kinase, partial [Planctomycetota bacterium]
MSQDIHEAFEKLGRTERNLINSLVQELENHYKQNLAQTSIEALLQRVDPELRNILLFELLHEETSRLNKLGLRPSQTELRKRFPEHEQVISAILAENTQPQFDIDVDALLQNHELITGYKFGKFELLSLLGEGSFGAVFEARDVTIDRLVALKVPRNKLMIEILGTKQFVDEARNSAALYHQNIVPVFEAGGYQDGGFYVACQLVEGPTLREMLKKPIEFKNALRIARDLASGVAHAHEHGVIHNDIKPANVLVDKLGEPKLTDFGMSQLTDSQKGSLSGGSIPYVA